MTSKFWDVFYVASLQFSSITGICLMNKLCFDSNLIYVKLTISQTMPINAMIKLTKMACNRTKHYK